MSNILKTLLVKIGVDLTDAQKQLKNVSKRFQETGKTLTNVGSNMSAALTLPILGAGVAAVKFASDAEESMNKVNVAFGASAGVVQAWAKDALKNFGMAEGSALDMAATFGDMGTAMGLTTADAAKMATSISGLAGDLASFKNIGLEQASDALRGIFTGEGEALKTLGIIMTDATLKQFALESGVKTAYEKMTQAEKVTLRYQYVMKTTTNAQGDFARTSGGVANQLRTVQEGLKQAAANLGKELLPAVAKALQSLNKLITSFTDMDEGTRKNVIAFGLIAAAIGPVVTIIGKLNSAISVGVTAVAKMAAAINSGAGFAGSLSALIGPAGLVTLAVVAIAALAAGIVYLTSKADEHSRKIRDMIKANDDAIKSFNDQADSIKINSSVTEGLVDELYNLDGAAISVADKKERMLEIVRLLNEQEPELSLAYDEQRGVLNKTRKEVDDLITSRKKELLLAVYDQKYIELLKHRLEYADNLKTEQAELNKRTEAYNRILNSPAYAGKAEAEAMALSLMMDQKKIVGDLTAAQADNEDQLRNTEDAMADTTRSIATNTAATKTNTAAQKDNKTAAEQTEASFMKTASGYRVSAQEIYDAMQKLKDGTKEVWDSMGGIEDDGIQKSKLTAAQVKHNLKQQIADMKEWRANLKTLAAKVPPDVYEELVKLGPQAAPLIKDLATGTDKNLNEFVAVWQQKAKLARTTAYNELSPFEQEAIDIGKNAGQGFADGLTNKKDEVRSAARALAMTADKQMRWHLETQSPSKLFRRIGNYTGQGFAIGMKDTVGMVGKSAKNLAKTASDKVDSAPLSKPDGPAMYGQMSLTVNGAANPDQVAGYVVKKLRAAGAIV